LTLDHRNLDDLLGDILRGAAKILGCSSTTLILINEHSQELRVRIGTTAESHPLLGEIESAIGADFGGGFSHPFQKTEDSLAYSAWRDRKILETGSFRELAGSAFDPEMAEAISGLMGDRRFCCVPAAAGNLNYGVLVFEKPGAHKFSRQQREVLIRYARGITALIESSLLGEGQTLLAKGREPAPGAGLDGALLRLTLGDPAPTIFIDTAGRVTSCNPAAERLFGWGDELRGQTLESLFRVPRDVRELFAEQVRDPGGHGRHEAATARRQDGSLFRAAATALTLADAKDRVVGFLVLVEEEPDESPDEREDFRDRLASLGEMAAQLAHEIRNPLVAIGATLESLEREELGEEPRAIIAGLTKRIAHLDMVLRGYMAGRLADPRLSDVRVAGIIEDQRRLLDAGSRLAGKSVRLDVDPALVVRADAEALSQVVFNLLSNALEASPAGGEVVCRATSGAHELAVSFEDDGPGLSAPASRCFQPFFTTKKDGTGLGLAVCQKLARAQGGLVELRNRPQGGCAATVVLPLARPASAAGSA
jgi:two-component system nitrogen regulation sensor histidine kinase GlnL